MAYLSAAATLSAATLRAGAAAVDITPAKWPVSLVGQFHDRQATNAFDRLHARALALEDGSNRIALVVVDNCVLPRAVVDAAKALATEASGIPAGRLLISATHTHSAPAAITWEHLGIRADATYLRQLQAGIATAVRQAVDNLQPAEVGWGVCDVPQHAFNRRWHVTPEGRIANPFGGTNDPVRTNPPRLSKVLIKPAGPTDPELAFVSVRTKDGRPLALLANYSLHYIGGVPAGGVSADYFGEFARQISDRLAAKAAKGPPFVGILCNGTSGDINNINFTHPTEPRKPFEQIRLVAAHLAEEVAAAVARTPHHPGVPVRMAHRELDVKLRKPSPELIAWAEERLAASGTKTAHPWSNSYAHWALELRDRPATERIVVQAVRIGTLGITAIPGEPFVEIGLELKRRSPLRPAFTIGLANGYSGYIPTPAQHELGGYETWLGSCTLDTNASVVITDTLLDMLGELRD